MKLSVLQEDLLTAVNLSSKFVSSKPQIPILANVLLKAEEGRLGISATNLETGIYTSVGAKIDEKGEITVPARIFAELISHLPSGKVNIESTEDKLTLTSGSFNASVAGINASEFPKVPDKLSKKTFSLNKDTLSKLSQQISFAAAADDTRPVLTGIFVTLEEKPTAAATDGFRMSYREIELSGLKFEADEKSFLLPARIIDELNRALPKNITEIGVFVSRQEGQLVFEGGNLILTSRFIEGEYPDFKRVIPKDKKTTINIGKEDLSRAIKAVAVFARESASIVKFKIEEGSVKLTSESTTYGKEEIEVEAKVEGDPVEIAFNYKFVLDALQAIEGDSLIMETQGPTSAGVFKDPKDSSFNHIIMPVRIQS